MEKGLNQVPFISVLIPTKNRSHLVDKAVQSVLGQTFEDFEIILVDNDDGDATEKVIKQFMDPRIRYYRTGGLSMPENWEYARRQAQGRYMTVLEDKQVYYPWALGGLYEVLSEGKASVCVWNWDANGLKTNHRPALTPADFHLVKSDDALESYVSGKLPWRCSPRMLNSCASKELVDSIAEHFAEKCFFIKFSPDMCAAFAQLGCVEYLYYTTSSLGFMSAAESNSTSYRKLKGVVKDYYAGGRSIDLSEAVSEVPIKNQYIVHNTVYNDFLRVRGMIGGRLENFTMSAPAYSKMCLADVILTFRAGGACYQELIDIRKYMRVHLSFLEQSKLWIWLFIQWLRWLMATTVRLFMRQSHGR